MTSNLCLKKTSDFRQIFKEGKRFTSPHFVLYMRRSAAPRARIGFSISKEHFKLATRRNKIRRVAKELFRTRGACLAGHDFVIASRARCPGADIKKALAEIKNLIAGPEKR
jgi:ribonuclease P protein component